MPLVDWIRAHEALVFGLAGGSVLMFLGTLLAVPFFVVRIPPNYFAHHRRHALPWENQHPVVRAMLLTAKNALGAVFILTGLALLFLPGQGLLTLVIGMLLINFPGKFRLECWAVTRRPVRRAIDWLRARAGVEPLRLPERCGRGPSSRDDADPQL